MAPMIERWYLGYLRLLVWGEDPHIGERRVADWSEHLEDFRAQRSYFTFVRELIFGSVAHLIFRLSDRSVTSTAVVVLALASGVVTTAASSFVGESVVSFTVAADLHFTIGIALMLWSMARRPSDLSSDRLRVTAMIVWGSSFWHSLFVISDVRADLWTSTYLALGGLGLLLVAHSAYRSGVLFGIGRLSASILVAALLVGALAYAPLFLAGPASLAGILGGMSAVEHAIAGFGVHRLWSCGRCIRDQTDV